MNVTQSPVQVHRARTTRSRRSVGVVVADGSFLVREALSRIIEDEDGLALLAACPDGDALLDAVERTRPDVVVVDADAAEAAQAARPRVGVVVLGPCADPATARTVLDEGSTGRAYLLRDSVGDADEVVAAIATVAAGGCAIDPKVVDVLVGAGAAGVSAQDRADRLAELTAREREVLAELAAGKSNAAIAESLVLSKRAVEKHINAIFLKLGLREEQGVSQRVKAALIHHAQGATPAEAP